MFTDEPAPVVKATRRSFLAGAGALAAGAALPGIARAATLVSAPTSKRAPRAARAPVRDNPFGINLRTDSFPPELAYKQAAEAKALGVGWVRGLHAGMDIVQPEASRWDWSRADAELALFISLGFRVLGRLGPAVGWAASLDPRRQENLSRRSDYPPGDMNDWSDHVGRVVARYKDRVKHWSPWNEPDGFAFWYPPSDDSQRADPGFLIERRQTYLDLQRAAFTAAKSADPTCFVLSPALALGGNYDADFAPWLFDHGLMDICDILDFHPYNTTATIVSSAAAMRAWARGTGRKAKPLWITETGLFYRAENVGSGPVSHDQVLDFAPKALATALAVGVQKVFWYEGYTDRPGDKLGPTVPLERSSYSINVTDGPTPAMWSLASAARLLRDARCLGRAALVIHSGLATAYRFATPDGELVIAWADDPAHLENKPASADTTLSWNGREIPLLLSERPTVLLG